MAIEEPDVNRRVSSAEACDGAVTFHDTNTVTIVNSQLPEADGQQEQIPKGFHANATGAVAVRFAGSTAKSILNVVDGSYYPYSCDIFYTTGTTVGAGTIFPVG